MADREFDHPYRPLLIKELLRLLQPRALTQIPAVPVAFLWFCDIENLTAIVRELRVGSEDDRRSRLLITVLTMNEPLLENVIDPWLRRRIPHEQEGPRYTKVASRTFDRDLGCIITKSGSRIVTHAVCILPDSDSMPVETESDSFWRYLKVFWPAQVVDVWKNEFTKDGGIERLENMITLDCSLSKAWNSCLFALEPGGIQSDMKMSLIFHWLKRGSPVHTIEIGKACEKPDFPAGLPWGHEHLKYYDQQKDILIRSGHKINMTTIGTVGTKEWPLPSMPLLTMQWYLHRIAAMTGAAAAAHPEDDYFNCGDDDGYGLDDSD